MPLETEANTAPTSAEARIEAGIRGSVRTIERCRWLQTILIVPCTILTACYFGDIKLWNSYIGPAGLPAIVALWGVMLLSLQPASRAVKRLAMLDSVRAIPALLDICDLSGLPYSSPAYLPLTRLIPRLTASDYDRVDAKHRKILMRILGRREFLLRVNSNAVLNLKIAILKVLARVGDEEAIPTVERLAESTREPQIRLAAAECLPSLRRKATEAAPGRTLLRAAAGPDSSGDLLRAAHEDIPQPTSILLRAAEDEWQL